MKIIIKFVQVLYDLSGEIPNHNCQKSSYLVFSLYLDQTCSKQEGRIPEKTEDCEAFSTKIRLHRHLLISLSVFQLGVLRRKKKETCRPVNKFRRLTGPAAAHVVKQEDAQKLVTHYHKCSVCSSINTYYFSSSWHIQLHPSSFFIFYYFSDYNLRDIKLAVEIDYVNK